MHLIYLDESGNSGNNLADTQQPVFVLCGLVVPESVWQPLEQRLQAAVTQYLPNAPAGFEVHGSDIRTGRGLFQGVSVGARIAFRDAWLDTARHFGLRVIYRAIEKRRYHNWLTTTFGAGVSINPHIAAFSLVARVVDEYLCGLEPSPLGMFISDDNREIVADVEKAIRSLRWAGGSLQLKRIIEKGFFIDSAASLPLQLCDLCALTVRKMEERRCGLPAKTIDDSAIELVKPMIHRGNEALSDVIAWLTEAEQKKKRPGTIS